MNAKQILDTMDYWGTMPTEPEAVVEAMLAAKNLGNKTLDTLEAQFPGVKIGFLLAAKKAIREERQNQHPISAADARVDRILRTRGSEGRATPRRWS